MDNIFYLGNKEWKEWEGARGPPRAPHYRPHAGHNAGPQPVGPPPIGPPPIGYVKPAVIKPLYRPADEEQIVDYREIEPNLYHNGPIQKVSIIVIH